MATQTLLLLVVVSIALSLAIYSEWLSQLRFPPTLWTMPLQRRPRKDLGIFAVLLLIVFIQQLMSSKDYLTSGLLLGLILLTLWFGWIRQPVVLVNAEGVVVQGRFIGWSQITRYQLTQQGELILHLTDQQITLNVTKMDDLERLYQHIITQPV